VSSSLADDPAARAALGTIAERQKRRIFWGLLQRVPVNLQAPLSPPEEAALRPVLSQPAIVELRRAAGSDIGSLPRRVAERFVVALAGRQRDAVAALLLPSLFARPDQAEDEWAKLRERYAESLLAGPLPAQLAGAKAVAGEDPRQWRITATSGETYELTLAALDGMPFVASLKRTQAGGAAKGGPG